MYYTIYIYIYVSINVYTIFIYTYIYIYIYIAQWARATAASRPAGERRAAALEGDALVVRIVETRGEISTHYIYICIHRYMCT